MHLPAEADLNDEERNRRAVYERELLELREAALSSDRPAPTPDPAMSPSSDSIGGGLLHYPDGEYITIVCAPFSSETLAKMGPYTDPAAPDYATLYKYADLDALIELHGHIRATNPQNEVRFRLASEVTADEMTSHLLLLGGVDWNDLTREVLDVVDVPVRQVTRATEAEEGGFEVVKDGNVSATFSPRMRKGQGGAKELAEDISHFYRAPSPFNIERTVTIFNGSFGRGVYGAVRTLTDARFRNRNSAYVEARLETADAISILTRVLIVRGEVLTPDWTRPNLRLHEWSGAS
jgi:hypothetical protein